MDAEMEASQLAAEDESNEFVPSMSGDGVVIHLEYDVMNPPPKPAPDEEWTRFVCISDTHSHTFRVPPGDVLLHSGDLTGRGRTKDLQKTMEWLYQLPHQVKVIIAGNHDFVLHPEYFDKDPIKKEELLDDFNAAEDMMTGSQAKEARIMYLRDRSAEFQAKEGGKTWSVYGSPWSPWFGGWAFNYLPEDAEAIASRIPKTDILLTHGPPKDILDMTFRHGEHAGCPKLWERLRTIQPRLHVFGHIHEARGALIHSWKNESDTTLFVNPANMPTGAKAKGSGWNKWRTPGDEAWRPIIVDIRD